MKINSILNTCLNVWDKSVHLGWSNKQRSKNMRQKWKSNYDTIHFCALKVVTETSKEEESHQRAGVQHKGRCWKGLKTMGGESRENSHRKLGADNFQRRNKWAWVTPQGQLRDLHISLTETQSQPHSTLLPTESQVSVWKEKASTHSLPKFSFHSVHVTIYWASTVMQFC